jgi:hypothetical protein
VLLSRSGPNGSLARAFLLTRRGSGLNERGASSATVELPIVESVIWIAGRSVGDICMSSINELLRDAGRRGRLGGDADLSDMVCIMMGCG